ncbi:MAG: ATP-binding protein, partial [Chitinophagaceae bacterium]|nr:ATP-binding protein [Chitinophagaceae bacterium]
MNLTYKLFIASSFNLYKERDQLEIAINRLNKEYFHQEQFIETVRWEALDGGISKTRMQDDTNNALLECDILVMLVWGELGKFTYEEFKVAHEAFLRGKLKKIYVFEKNLPLPEGFNSNIENQENLKKLKHFFSAEGREYWPTAFEHIAEVNLHLTYWLKDVFSNKLNPDFSIALRQGAKRLSLNGPARPDIFLGREKELKEISQRLKTQTNLLLINAEGGIGKTTLAAQYWYDSMLDYKYHAWLYCEEGILKALLTMATEMGIIFSGPVSMEEQIHELKVKLKDIEDGFFLVLDNANNEAEIEKFKKEFKGWNWRVLFTSRCHLVLNDREEMLIAHLPPNLAKELFLTYYREEHNNFNSQLDQVLSAINYHTLLIEVFAKNLAKAARIGYTMTGFLQQLEQGGLFLSEHSFKIKSEWGSLNDVANSDDIIAAIYDFSSLPEKEKYTLLNLAFLPADTYNLSFLLSLFANGQGKREYVDAIENLVHWGWLNESGDTYRLSPVIQKLMLLKEKENLEIASNSLMERLSDLLDCDAYNLLNLSLKEALPYVNLVKHCCQCLKAFPSEDIANLHFGCVIFHGNLGNVSAEMEHAKQYQEIYLCLHAMDPENLSYKNGLAISYSKLGGIYEATGDWQNPLKNYEEDFRITQEIYASSPENLRYKNGLAISYEKLGGIYEATGDWQNALKNYESQLNLFLEIYASSPENLSYKNGLAIS